ncbi:unnamed protein product [Effrenium voratum]|uniref:Uncharacterized protein n=1 Tax=Effrenium voratum TaxID=2562239 RepID=A0AA36JMQ9_9DINO|nr:unnamed protein product [Effrenium voratum]
MQLQWGRYLQELALVANAYARCNVPPTARVPGAQWQGLHRDPAQACEQLFEELAQLALQNLQDLQSQDAALICNAFAKLDAPGGRAGQALLSKMSIRMQEILPTMTLPNMAAAGWAFARLRHPQARALLGAIAEQLQDVGIEGLQRCSAQELVNLLSAFAKARVRHQRLLENVAAYLNEKPKVIAGMVPLDILYTASSLARLRIRDEQIYKALAKKMMQSRKVSAKQAIYLLQSFSQAQCTSLELAESLAPLLRLTLAQGHTKDPSLSDWVVALGALTSLPSSMEVHALCEEIVEHCARQLAQGRAISALDTSQLLRALARRPQKESAQLVQLLLWKVLSEHEGFSVLDLLGAIHAAVSMYEEGPSFGVTDSLHSSLMSLLLQEASSSRMVELSCSELMSLASVLSKGVLDLQAWSVVMREATRLLAEGEGSGEATTLASTITVVLNCCARLSVRDELFLRRVYSWLAESEHLEGERKELLAGSLAKLGAAGWMESRALGNSSREYLLTWAKLGSAAELEDRGLLFLGLAQALHGLPAQAEEFRELLRRKFLQQVRLTSPSSIQAEDLVMNFQIYTGLQCFHFYQGLLSKVALEDLRVLRQLLEVLEPSLQHKNSEHAEEGATEVVILEALEKLAVQFRDMANLRPQEHVDEVQWKAKPAAYP